MKISHFLILIVLLSIICFSCKKDQILNEEITSAKNDSLLSIFSNKKIPENPIIDLSDNKTYSSLNRADIIRDSTWHNNTGRTYFVESDNILVSPETYDIAYPGAIIESKALINEYVYRLINDRLYDPLPIKISLSIPGSNVSGIIDYPELHTTRDMIGQILGRQGNVNQINSFSYNSHEFKDYNELKYTFGANINIGKIVEVGLNGGQTKIKKKTGVIIKYQQENFTVDMSIPRRTELISVSDVNALGEYAPLYVNSVTFGRLGVFTAETDASFEDFNIAFKAAVKIASVGVDTHISSEQKKILDEATIHIYMKFGSGPALTKTVNGYEDFKKAILDGATVDAQSYGGPISLRMRNLKNFELFKTIYKVNVKN